MFVRLLENMAISAKLIGAFATVLVLTIIVALGGYKGISLVVERSDKVVFAQSVHELLLKAEILRHDYTAGNADIQELQKLIDTIETTISDRYDDFSDPKDKKIMDYGLSSIKKYKSGLVSLINTHHEEDTIYLKMKDEAKELTASITELENVLLKDQNSNSNWSLIHQLSRLNHLFSMTQMHVVEYVGSPSDENANAVKQRLATLINERDNLLIDPDTASRLAQISRGIDAFHSQFSVLAKKIDKTVATSEQVEKDANALVDSVYQMVNSQQQKRHDDTQWAIILLVIVTAVALLLGALSAWFISHTITDPIRGIVASAKAITAGDLTQTITSKRQDEIGVLINAIGQMNKTLHEVLEHIGTGVAQLASSAAQLSAVTEQNSAGMQQQRSETDQVATAINEMTATVQEVARNAEEAANAANEADRTTASGNQVVRDAMQQIETLAQEILVTAKAMEQLKTESDSIGQVLEVIKMVAEQTNLLALNAAIEAARAGEAGRGFAVVADEVRTLARRTHDSTEEIEALISSLQHGAQESLGMMQRSQAMTDESVTMARSAGDMLEQIAGAVSHIQDMNQQIAAAAEEQSSVSEEINQSVVKVREITEQSSSASEETANATEDLANLGHNLQEMVARFKL